MGTTAEKLTYLNGTKSAIKDSINLGGGNLTTEPFREYASAIKDRYLDFMNNGTDEVWNNWEKVNGTGTTLSLNNTVEAPMSIEYKGNTSQNGTPTPSSPQTIHTVSGSNTITVSNGDTSNSYEIDLSSKNMFDGNWINGQISSSNGNLIDSTGVRSSANFIEIEPNTTYTISRSTDVSTIPLRFYNGTKTFLSAMTGISSGKSATFTSPNNAYYLKFVDWSNASENVMLEKGSTVSKYQPYNPNPIELNKISTYQDYIRKSSGKNLIGLGTQLNGFTDTSNIFHTYSTNSIGYYFETAKLPNQITFSCVGGNRANVSYFNVIPVDNATATLRDASEDNPRTITINKTYSYIHIQFSYNDANVSNIMLNEGETALSYEPYGKIWYKYSAIGKKQVLSTDNLTYSSTYDIFYDSDFANLYNPSIYPISNYFTGTSGASGNNGVRDKGNGIICFRIGSTTDRLYFTKYDTTDLQTFKNWIDSIDLFVYYVLATPTYTKIEDTTLINQLEAIKSKTGQTNITQVPNDLPFELSVTALEG